MNPRLYTFERLIALYKSVEEMHSVELQRNLEALQEAEQAIQMQLNIARSAQMDCRSFLEQGDRPGWSVAHLQEETSAWKRLRLDGIRREREVLSNKAREQYLTSRLKSEQVTRVNETIVARVEVEERRRVQAASDDRFLARRRWADVQEKQSKAFNGFF